MFVLTFIFRVYALDAIIALISECRNSSTAYFLPPTLWLLLLHTLHEKSTHGPLVVTVFTVWIFVIEFPNTEHRSFDMSFDCIKLFILLGFGHTHIHRNAAQSWCRGGDLAVRVFLEID